MKISNETREIEWITENLNFNNRSNTCNYLFPDIFDNYYKVFFPFVIQDLAIKSKIQLSSKDQADRLNIEYENSFSITDVIIACNGLPNNYLRRENEDSFISKLIELLEPDISCVFYGSGDDILSEEFASDWLIKGKLNILKDILKKLNRKNEIYPFMFFPRYIYDENKSWCAGWNVQVNEIGMIVLGCSNELSSKLENQCQIDYQKINFDDEYLKYL